MLNLLFSSAITSVLVALFLSSVGPGKREHVVVVGVLALLGLLWLVGSIVSVSQ